MNQGNRDFTCADCKYHYLEEDENRNEVGPKSQCRLNPPIVTWTDEHFACVFPYTAPDWWCSHGCKDSDINPGKVAKAEWNKIGDMLADADFVSHLEDKTRAELEGKYAGLEFALRAMNVKLET